jgi:hypothetical protein
MTTMLWECVCETVNSLGRRTCQSCGASKPRVVAAPANPLPPRTPWVPHGPRPCTDVENEGALKIVLAVLDQKMTVEEAQAHLHNIFQGRELL